MSRYTSPRLFVAIATAVTLAACSSQSPVAPGAASSVQGSGAEARPPSGIPGVYALTFHAQLGNGGFTEVSSLPVSIQGVPTPSLHLKAQVTDASGNPATSGTVTFQYCSYGKPTNDITNPDEAPLEDCNSGAATWVELRRAMRVNDGSCVHLGSPSACTGFGPVRIPRSVGFRFRYTRQGSGIASGTSPARNFVWVAR